MEDEGKMKNSKKNTNSSETSKGSPTSMKEQMSRRKKFKEKLRILSGKRMDAETMNIKDGEKPPCWGHYVVGHTCNCPCAKACEFVTYDNMAERSRQMKWDLFFASPLNENINQNDDEQENDENESIEKAIETMSMDGTGEAYFQGLDGSRLLPSDVNVTLIQVYMWIAIESPFLAQAFLARINPDVHSLEDIAILLGVSKQAIHKRLATELGMGKKPSKNSLLKMTNRELDVYRLHFIQGKSINETAKKLKVSRSLITKYTRTIKQKGF